MSAIRVGPRPSVQFVDHSGVHRNDLAKYGVRDADLRESGDGPHRHGKVYTASWHVFHSPNVCE